MTFFSDRKVTNFYITSERRIRRNALGIVFQHLNFCQCDGHKKFMFIFVKSCSATIYDTRIFMLMEKKYILKFELAEGGNYRIVNN